MIKADSYSAKGTKAAAVALPKSFEVAENRYLLSQAVRVYENRVHIGISRTKTRSEIVASKKKIYAQKGTGNARHGALSAPIFVGGSKAHGPKGIKKILSMSSKMRRKAAGVALSMKARDNMIVVVNTIGSLKKTKEAARLIQKILVAKKMKATTQVSVVLSEKNYDVYRVFRNIENVQVFRAVDLNAHTVFKSRLIIFDNDVFHKPSDKSKVSKGVGKKTATAKTQNKDKKAHKGKGKTKGSVKKNV